MAITMVYGSYSFNPVPLFSSNVKEYRKTDAGQILSCKHGIALNGVLTPLATGGVGGISNVYILKNILYSGLKQQGCELKLSCDSSTLLSVYPKINSINFADSTNHETHSISYTIDLEYEDTLPSGEISGALYLDSMSEEWSLEPQEDKPFYTNTLSTGSDTRPLSYRLSHNLSAKGNAVYSGCGTLAAEPWTYARDFCSGRLGYNSGNLGLALNNLTPFNHSRTQTLNKEAGRYAVVENWLIFDTRISGVPGNALEDFTVDVKKPSASDIISVGIQGTIQGLESVSYTGINTVDRSVSISKFSSALTYWSGVSGRLLARAQNALTNAGIAYSRSLNPTLIDKSISQNMPNGVLSYSYEFTNKPSPCVSNALVENINFSYAYPQDIYGAIPIIGRSSGPIIQLMGTRTPYTLTASVDVVVPIVTGCTFALLSLTGVGCPHSDVKTFLSSIESSLGSNDTLVKIDDKPSWIPTEGKYSRSVTWLYNTCAGSGTAVSELT